jgi:hypothetical protein
MGTSEGGRAQRAPLRFPVVMLVIYLASLQVEANGKTPVAPAAFGACEIVGQARPAPSGPDQ